MVFFTKGEKLMEAIAQDDKCRYWRGAQHPQQLYAPIILPDQPPDEVGQRKFIFKNQAIAKVRPNPTNLDISVFLIVCRSFA